MLLSIISFTTLALSRAVAANPDTAVSRAIMATDALQTWYNRATGIWDTCGWWNGANCMTTLADLAALKVNNPVNGVAKDVFQNTFSVAPNSNPYPERGIDADYTSANGMSYSQTFDRKLPTGAANASLWLDGSYDDDAWWGLAWVAVYDATGQADYLDLAEGIFYHLCGNGGIDSDYTHVYVGAVANELYLALAAQLANRASDGEYYLDWAKRQWSWFRDSGLINENYTINDGLTNDCANNGDTVWTYNQGITLGGLVELSRAVDNETLSNSMYLQEAQKIAAGAIAALADNDHVLHDPCEPDSCGADQTQFKGIFIRNLRLLHEVAPNDTFAKVVNSSARSLWANDRTDENQFGVDWSGPVDSAKIDASTHSSALDALVAAIWK
ncbi:putative glycosyl hydrolase [Aspergillus foveolatus]|uniref:putative glycosyl hydrolase n=1 Tax=Aspergillus foveolatus TaxID=210207 RepID=UPI003CCCDB5C